LKSLWVSLAIIFLGGCKAGDGARTLVSINPDLPSENIIEEGKSYLILRVENVVYSASQSDWLFSAYLSNGQTSASKKVQNDFGDSIDIQWGTLNESMGLNREGSFYETASIEVSASNVTALIESQVNLQRSNNQMLGSTIDLNGRTLMNPLSPPRLEDADLFNCFSSGQAPAVNWTPSGSSANLTLDFKRESNTLSARYTNLNDSLGRWNEAIASRSFFQQILSPSERSSAQSEELVVDVIRVLTRSQKIGVMSLNTVPKLQVDVILEVIDDRPIFVYYLEDCE
jgi:hypothetical protein